MTAGFWTQVLAEVLASCPVFAAGLWLSHRAARRRLDAVTREQTERIAGITRAITGEQTAELLPGLVRELPGQYKENEDQG